MTNVLSNELFADALAPRGDQRDQRSASDPLAHHVGISPVASSGDLPVMPVTSRAKSQSCSRTVVQSHRKDDSTRPTWGRKFWCFNIHCGHRPLATPTFNLRTTLLAGNYGERCRNGSCCGSADARLGCFARQRGAGAGLPGARSQQCAEGFQGCARRGQRAGTAGRVCASLDARACGTS